ncbi:L-serine ammonia-lyase, iron-sulfur-dependent, subunit alpha [Desulfovibrio sp. Huiquan2017]|uniref:L-cysteine desulfidase family protein n=1 Tax=Desulfovibrio sp. Huiquan2017 TaxID=2816861 RepID=UPI001A9395DD|nr:L-serine ammonia-lyase, iron-sulfur-dependent, subunit alpha [Desulfovibrio sp. Huiquan2017]
MSKKDWAFYRAIIDKEVVPALGCTEPITISLAAARAAETLGVLPERISVLVSGNLLKNGMGVGVPGTGTTGLDIAAAVGVTGGKSELGLEVLRDLSEEQVRQGKQLLEEGRVSVGVTDVGELLYAEVTVEAGGETARCAIAREHTAIVLVEKNGDVLLDKRQPASVEESGDWPLSISDIYEYATEAPLEDLDFILEAARMNEAAAAMGLESDWGLQVGRSMDRDLAAGLRADDIISYATKLTAAASDARMEGAPLPVMSNSGSGNQGLTATLPVVAFARRRGDSEEALVRALIMSHLTAIHLKHHLGRLSALCGASLAATAAGCGIVLLLGGGLHEIESAIRNTVGDIAGMVCDGAKTSCALKVASCVEAAINAALLAMKGISIPGRDGIVADDIEACIRNIGRLGSVGMVETDKVILDIMTSKRNGAAAKAV